LPDGVLARLQEAARRDVGDFMTFEIRPDDDHPEIQNDGMPYAGLRFSTEGKLAGKLYGQRFGVDVAFGDPMVGEPEVVVSEYLLAFAGIAPPALRICPIETHIAEKLHAYTMPRPRPNSRVKDLPDIALLATVQPINAQRLRDALAQTFTYRKTHALPAAVPAPLSAWATPYLAMAREDRLAWPTLDGSRRRPRRFSIPCLQEDSTRRGSPRHGCGEPHSDRAFGARS